jgi:hypothetical protein
MALRASWLIIMWKCSICGDILNCDFTTRSGYSLRARHLSQKHKIKVNEISVQKRHNDKFILEYYNEIQAWNKRRGAGV